MGGEYLTLTQRLTGFECRQEKTYPNIQNSTQSGIKKHIH
jgi:hypothetical protein